MCEEYHPIPSRIVRERRSVGNGDMGEGEENKRAENGFIKIVGPFVSF
jgi:hypothetical protein